MGNIGSIIINFVHGYNPPSNPVDEIGRRVQEVIRAQISSPLQSCRRDEVVNWKLPQEGWVKVNADGTPGPKVALTGRALQDANGAWLGGFHADMGYACG
ncbi:hypothetical protein Acr_16g0009550 [Actinidia rufa]|uniref:Uncharacterized protein n=1 Tax=Actinidia rufa TaxID=165716 RepID=A0A7J0G068_9ERIC|nr:hypothetical protein Acr_16g0009550 [Actinidia rufa]